MSLSSGKAFIAQAAQALDDEIAERFHTNAAVNLRNGLASLPVDTRSSEFVEQAPELIYFYIYALYKLEWYDVALASGMQWLFDAFEPSQWGKKPSSRNPLF